MLKIFAIHKSLELKNLENRENNFWPRFSRNHKIVAITVPTISAKESASEMEPNSASSTCIGEISDNHRMIDVDQLLAMKKKKSPFASVYNQYIDEFCHQFNRTPIQIAHREKIRKLFSVVIRYFSTRNEIHFLLFFRNELTIINRYKRQIEVLITDKQK